LELWQRMKSGQTECTTLDPASVPGESGSADCGFAAGKSSPTAGKVLIERTAHRIAELWNEVESSGGSVAWEWILRESVHGPKIRRAEARVDAVGSEGDQAALASACGVWLAAWGDAILEWKTVSLRQNRV
jgi:hypothetical protein